MFKKRQLTARHPTRMLGFFKIEQTTQVDTQTWYTVKCTKEVGAWIRETYKDQQDNLWYEHIDRSWMFHKNKFDIHEKVYTMLALRWSQ